MENSNLIQPSIRKRKLSAYLRDDEEYYIPKRKQKPTSAPPHTSSSSKKSESKAPEAGTSLESLRKENESLASLCSELSEVNKKLQEQNSELQEKLKFTHDLTGNIQDQDENDQDSNWQKYPIGTLNVETLADLWNEVCTIPIPSCSCSTKVNAVAKKRVTQSITPLIAL